jgi:hypothetical protein
MLTFVLQVHKFEFLLRYLAKHNSAGHCAGDKMERNEIGGACISDVYRVLLGKSEGKRPLRRPRCRWEDNIKMDLQEVGCVCRGWIGWLIIETGGEHL